MCEHQYEYAGVRYCDSRDPMPGTGATQRYYAHVYFCTKCTETKGQPIKDDHPSGRPRWNSYGKVEFGATPGSPEECGVPKSRYY
jgi:hypothetical protein